MARKKAEPAATGDFVVAVLDIDMIRVDLYGQCTPAASGDPQPGWGVATLTNAQAHALAVALSRATVQATPAKPKRKKA